MAAIRMMDLGRRGRRTRPLDFPSCELCCPRIFFRAGCFYTGVMRREIPIVGAAERAGRMSAGFSCDAFLLPILGGMGVERIRPRERSHGGIPVRSSPGTNAGWGICWPMKPPTSRTTDGRIGLRLAHLDDELAIVNKTGNLTCHPARTVISPHALAIAQTTARNGRPDFCHPD